MPLLTDQKQVDSQKIESIKSGKEMLLFEETFPIITYSTTGLARGITAVTTYATLTATYSTNGVTMKTRVYLDSIFQCNSFVLTELMY